jgi:hypothetical protein
MGKFHNSIQEHHAAFILKQKLFFVASAPLSSDGHVNLSPKGLDSFRILSPTQVAYLDIVGSGNETSAHMLENGRITFMFCAFEDAPNILRLYGKGYTVLPGDERWTELSAHFTLQPATRQIIKCKHPAVLVCLCTNMQAKGTMHKNGLRRKAQPDWKRISRKKTGSVWMACLRL